MVKTHGSDFTYAYTKIYCVLVREQKNMAATKR